PALADGVEDARRRIGADLLPRIRALTNLSGFKPALVPELSPVKAMRGPVELVAIGVSTGGPNALAEVIPRLPGNLSVPVVMVQHMPPVFTRLLAERLTSRSAVPVAECVDGEPLRPGRVYIAPGDFHMELCGSKRDAVLKLTKGPPENSCRPAVDVLFRSVAASFGASAMGVIMTGMGRDGLNGCRHIHEAGGRVVVQDQATSVIWGMPGAVAQAGIADKILPLGQVADEIVRAVR
ncbi:MAG TPA: CheB methylesterase domain-containing protein, partial [Myxococcales bacterium]|nr:CheB methylesterase domain-containing protein [Myxococcales bacterium]